MGDSNKENKSLDRLNHIIKQKTSENEALKKLLSEINKEERAYQNSKNKK